MKKLLLSSAALLAFAVANPAQAEEFLKVGGNFKGYAAYTDQDETTGQSLRQLDLRKETEAHFSGETTLDNGLTVGAHVELNVDRGTEGLGGSADAADRLVEESYGYFSGGWGRVNFGEEDGAAYLLQVAAPSADNNVDGIRQFIQTFDLDATGAGLTTNILDYQQILTSTSAKVTYLTPSFNGFQVGASYTPSISDADLNNLAASPRDDNAGEYDNGLEIAARYEGEFNGVGVAAGAGYGKASLEAASAGRDDQKQYNVGLDLDFAGFGLGAAYLVDDNGVSNNGDTKTWVVGADYQTGPYTLGLSYFDRTDEAASGNQTGGAGEVDTTRWTAGVGYEYGPGMTFRGAVQLIDVETAAAGDDEVNGTQVTLGTNINF